MLAVFPNIRGRKETCLYKKILLEEMLIFLREEIFPAALNLKENFLMQHFI